MGAAMIHFRPSHCLIAMWFVLATSSRIPAESPAVDLLARGADDGPQALYPLEWLTRSAAWDIDGLISCALPDRTSLERLAAFRSIWPEINVWSDGVPLLTSDFRRLAPDADIMSRLRPEGDKHVAKSSTDFEWAALNSKIAVRDRDDLLAT